MADPAPDLDGLRAGLHAMWSAVAGGWEDEADLIDERQAALTDRMLDTAGVRAGDRVLELACGPAGLGLAAAERAGPDGTVVVSDVSPQMVEIAQRRAAARGLANVTARVLDLEAIDEPDAAHDVVLCREGLMLVPEPRRAAAEIARVLAPGGRFAVAVWGPRARNPWLGALFDAVSDHLGAPVPPPGLPQPFSLDDPDRLAAVLDVPGLEDVAIAEEPVVFPAASVDAWLMRVGALAGPLAQLLAGLPEEGRAAIREHATAGLAPYTAADGTLEVPGVSLVAGGRRA